MNRQAVRTTAGKVLRSDELIANEKEVAARRMIENSPPRPAIMKGKEISSTIFAVLPSYCVCTA
jgi:hypothetical protein